MVKGEHVHKDVAEINTTADSLLKSGKLFEGTLLKALTLLIKIVLNIRQNQVNVMSHEGVELIKPKARTDEKTK